MEKNLEETQRYSGVHLKQEDLHQKVIMIWEMEGTVDNITVTEADRLLIFNH